jgi:hypothetical protein
LYNIRIYEDTNIYWIVLDFLCLHSINIKGVGEITGVAEECIPYLALLLVT